MSTNKFNVNPSSNIIKQRNIFNTLKSLTHFCIKLKRRFTRI